MLEVAPFFGGFKRNLSAKIFRGVDRANQPRPSFWA